MDLKCTHYTTCITLNILQTGCTVASQLGFEAGSLDGSIEGKHITLKNSNNTLLAMKLILYTEEFL